MTAPQHQSLKTAQTIIRVASLIGLLDSVYLSYVKLTHTPIYCTPGLGDCATVNSSRWSELWGIPIAIYGILAFGSLLLLSFYGKKVKLIQSYDDYLIFAIAIIGVLFSAYLTYLEAFVIHAFCQWCILSALSMLIIFIASLTYLLKKDMLEKKEEIYATH